MSAGEDGSARARGDERPEGAETPAEALARAARHGRLALAETARAAAALLDAGSLLAGGEPATVGRLLGPLSRTLDALAGELDPAAGDAASGLLTAIAEALDAEIARWELRARDDPDARAVLRAFLGLRELLWELGVRRPGEGSEVGTDPARAHPLRPRRAKPRVQRVRVEG